MTQKDFKFGVYARATIPAVMGIIAILFSAVPMKFPISGAVSPSFALMIVYFWSIHRPDLLPLWLCFILGIYLDFVSGVYIGVNALILVLCRWIMISQRRYLGTGFAVLWVGFCFVAFGQAGITWLLRSLLEFKIFSIQPVLYRSIVSIFLFPVVAWVLVMIHRAYLQNSRGNNG